MGSWECLLGNKRSSTQPAPLCLAWLCGVNLRKTALQTCLSPDSDGDSWITCFPFSHLVGFAALWQSGEVLRGGFWPVKRAGLVWECLPDSQGPALLYPGGRDGRSSPSPLPQAQLQGPTDAFPHPAYLPAPLLLLLLFLPALSLGNFSLVGWWLQPDLAGHVGGRGVAQGYRKIICCVYKINLLHQGRY